MNPEKLVELAVRAERASADEQAEVIREAWDALRPPLPVSDEGWFDWCQDRAQLGAMLDFGAYESAAMLLVPLDGSMNFVEISYSWEPSEPAVYPAASLRWYPPHHSGPDWHAEVVTAATLPLTICVAALKVRARAHAQGSKT